MTGEGDRREDFSRRLRNDMEVIGADGNHLGHVRQIRPKDFLLHRPLAVAVFVPFAAVERVSEADNRVFLDVSEGQIAETDWPSLDADVTTTKPL